MFKVATHSKFSRWKGLAGAVYLELLAGLMALFPFYSADLKRILGADQKLLSWCSTAGAIGGNVAFTSGFFYDRFGGMVTGMAGTLLQSIGFGAVYLATAGVLPRDPIMVASLFGLATFGGVFQDTAAIASCITAFPYDKGLVSGMVGTMFGLCSSMMVVLTVGLLGHSKTSSLSTQPLCEGDVYIGSSSQPVVTLEGALSSETTEAVVIGEEADEGLELLLFVSMLNFMLGLSAAMFLPFGPPRDLLASMSQLQLNLRLSDHQRAILHKAYVFVTLIVIFLGLTSLLNAAWSRSGEVPHKAQFIFALVLLVSFVWPFLIAYYGADSWGSLRIEHNVYAPAPAKPFSHVSADGPVVGVDVNPLLPRSPESTEGLVELDEVAGEDTGNYAMQDYTACEAIQSTDFWLLLLAGLGGSGAAAMTNTQLAQIAASLGRSPYHGDILIILAGLGNGFVQLMTGFLQEPLLRRGYTRPLLCWICVVVSCLAQFIMSLASYVPGGLEVGLFLTMMMPGAIWSLLGPTTADVLGNSNIGVLYAAVAVGCTPGIIFFNQLVAGPLYDSQYAQGLPNDTKTCCGRACYQKAHLITGAVTGVISLAPLLLFLRTRSWYLQYYFESEEEQELAPPLSAELEEEFNSKVE